MIYTYAMNPGSKRLHSPADRLGIDPDRPQPAKGDIHPVFVGKGLVVKAWKKL